MGKKSFLLFSFAIVVVVVLIWRYTIYIQAEKKNFETSIYKKEARYMHKNLVSMINKKKKATTAIAIALALNELLPKDRKKQKILEYKLNHMILDFKEYTNYKNIWIHILDKNAHFFYHSLKMEDRYSYHIQEKELDYLLKNRNILSLISVDDFTLNIKAVAPLYNNENKFEGFVEVISHFNSIAEDLKKFDVDSVVVVNEEQSKYITQPFTNIYIDKHYIANFNAPKKLLIYLKKYGIKNYCKIFNKIENGYVIESYPLKNYAQEIIGYYIMFKKTKDISHSDLNFFVFKWTVFAVLFLMVLAGIINLIFYHILKQQKLYYKNILDTLSNMVLIHDKKNIIAANTIFFQYFKRYQTIEEFKKEHQCICKFFVETKGYLSNGNDITQWLDYLLDDTNKQHKAKLNIDGKIYYFLINATLISKEQEHFSIVFSDITEQEIYKKELEERSLLDPLTGIGNRRKYRQRVEDEMRRECRYKIPFSILSFDIDHFKKVNDMHGHLVGDEVLKEYTQLVRTHLRNLDEVFRIGGEEFLVIVPNTTKEDAAVLAEKLRKKIAEHKKVVPITVSFGVSQYCECEDEDELLKRVDDALYEAKNSGRNRVVMR